MNLALWSGVKLLIQLLFSILRRVLFVLLTGAPLNLSKTSLWCQGALPGASLRDSYRVGMFFFGWSVVCKKNPSKTIEGVEGRFRGLYVKCFEYIPPFLCLVLPSAPCFEKISDMVRG